MNFPPMSDRVRRWAVAASCVAAVLAASCTAVNTAHLPGSPVADGPLFVTTSDIDLAYDSLGPIQATRRGVVVFGFLDPVGFDLERCVNDTLIPEARRIGANGVINLRFEQTQLTPATRVLGAFLFFIPFPVECTVRGEAVLVRRTEVP